MSLDEKFIPLRTGFYNLVETIFKIIARFFGYPANRGMPIMPDTPKEVYAKSRFIDSLPTHRTFWPPPQQPETWFEVIFGPTPKLDTLPRYIYETREEGFYNFYIENYKNIYFLPDWLSEFLQVRCNLCLDISFLETIREVFFVGLAVYCQMILLRITISWFVSINPFTIPWCYLIALVDWTEEILQGIIPSILGINITGSVFLGMIGILADSLNHLVFTMPYLPSEGEETKLLMNEQMKDVLVFHYLPILWYRYPIPNTIRQFWYNERPDIIDYMQKAYKGLEIQFLPDEIVRELYRQRMALKLTSMTPHLPNFFATELLSKHEFDQKTLFLENINSLQEHFHTFAFHHSDKFF